MNDYENHEDRGVNCGNCNAANPHGSKFCGSCGTALQHTEVSTIAKGDSPTKKSSPAIKIIAAVGALAIGVGGFVYFMGQIAAPTTIATADNPWPDIDISSIRTTLNEQSGSLWILDTAAEPVGAELALLRTSPSADCSLLVFANSESAVETIDAHFPDFIFGESVMVGELIDSRQVVALFENTSGHKCFRSSALALGLPTPSDDPATDALNDRLEKIGSGANFLYASFTSGDIEWTLDPFEDANYGSILTFHSGITDDGSECTAWVYRTRAELDFARGEGLFDFAGENAHFGANFMTSYSVIVTHMGTQTDCFEDALTKLNWTL